MSFEITTKDLDVFYGEKQALKKVNLCVNEHQITALMGPSGCGKSTLLRSLNRMNDNIAGVRVEGQVLLGGRDVYAPEVDAVEIRQRVGMVFQQPNPLPKSIFENIAFGPKVLGMKNKTALEEIAEKSLRAAALWDEVKDELKKSALALSGGQQQRLCIARALAIQPEVILMDEPCSALDPFSTLKIEELMQVLKKRYTIVIVTHNMQQAARVSDWTGFFLMGKLIEYDETAEVFSRPKDKRTENYITGRFG
ncbi:MAG: phosphate ABC transporter ATP-binding protein PstB [Actinomycetota bacterium]|nr:phosphate ABC transporter ATP-binding protein PstB [Actinomycetota bacterium]